MSLLVLDDFMFGQEYLRAAGRLGIATILIAKNPPGPETQELVGRYVQLDPLDRESVVATVVESGWRHEVEGVVPGHVYHVGLMARLHERLGLSGMSVAAADRCLQKDGFRAALAAAGIAQAWSFPVRTESEIADAVERAALPCIVKPCDGFASIGIVQVEDAAALRAALTAILRGLDYGARGKSLGTRALVEQLLDGPEVSVETVSSHGKTEVVGVTGKHFDRTESPFELGFELPPRLGADEARRAAEHALAVCAALGVTHGFTHMEMRMTAEGPRVIEVNPRLGGAHLADLYEVATGVNLFDLAVLNAVDRPLGVSLPLPVHKAAATRWVMGRAGEIAAIEGLAAIEASPTLQRVIQRKQVGDVIAGKGDNRDRVAALVAAGSALPDVHRALDEAVASVVVRYAE